MAQRKKRVKKLSDKQFFEVLRSCAGLYARTARKITRELGIPYTRQAVRDRALANPDELEDINEEAIDLAEETLHSLMRSKDERIAIQAVKLYLTTKGGKRGYTQRSQHEVSGPNGGPVQQQTFNGWDFLPGSPPEAKGEGEEEG